MPSTGASFAPVAAPGPGPPCPGAATRRPPGRVRRTTTATMANCPAIGAPHRWGSRPSRSQRRSTRGPRSHPQDRSRGTGRARAAPAGRCLTSVAEPTRAFQNARDDSTAALRLREDRGGCDFTQPKRATKERLPCESCSRSTSAAKGSAALRDGSMQRIMEEFMNAVQPEAAFFAPEGGVRSATIVFDMKHPFDAAPLEPFFSTFEAEVDLTPVMNADDLRPAFSAWPASSRTRPRGTRRARHTTALSSRSARTASRRPCRDRAGEARRGRRAEQRLRRFPRGRRAAACTLARQAHRGRR